jgi:hypothetical protein
MEKQQNYRNIENMLHEGIAQAVRSLVPVKSILKDFVTHDSTSKDDEDSDEETEKIEVPKPPKCKSGSKPARRCADLFDWEKLEPFDIKGKASTYKGFKVPYLAGKYSSAAHAAGHNFVKGYHACSAYALYSQISHGMLRASTKNNSGDRALDGYDGVYLFTEKDISSGIGYSTGVELGWNGVSYHFMWEVLFEEPKTMRGGTAKNQVVVDPDKLHLTSLIIFTICADGRKHNDDTCVFDYM